MSNNNAEREDLECNGSNNTCDFAIPELPQGKLLRFILLSSWDDPHFIGLGAIELFNAIGNRPLIDKIETNANITYGSLNNIFMNGEKNPYTNDPCKMWSARYDDLSEPLCIEIYFKEMENLAMIRIWNYNESRVHALRGVHDLCIDLDGTAIFCGEISCAFTFESEEEPMGDTILFTTNDAVLELIAENDECLRREEAMCNTSDLYELSEDLKEELSVASGTTETPFLRGELLNAPNTLRPDTGDRKLRARNATRSNDRKSPNANAGLAEEVAPKLPLTTWGTKTEDECVSSIIQNKQENNKELTLLKVFHMELLENWGASDCIGLTGLQFLGPHSTVVDHLDCKVTTSAAMQTAHRLFNGKNLTRSRNDMWLSPYSKNSPPIRITVTFVEPIVASGISVWNYNASPEMSYAGVRCIQMYINGRPLQGLVLLRKAPGYIYFDYVQDIIFNKCIFYRPISRPQTYSINGFTYQLQLHCTWGDEYYIGLSGIEFYDHNEELIQLLPQNMAAFPESVNVLPNVNGDPRTSEKLIDGHNDTDNPSHMWLTPILPNRCARVFIIFDIPTYVSRINVYNYRKTPERGVRLITISVDDLIVFSGEVPQSTSNETGILSVSLREE